MPQAAGASQAVSSRPAGTLDSRGPGAGGPGTDQPGAARAQRRGLCAIMNFARECRAVGERPVQSLQEGVASHAQA